MGNFSLLYILKSRNPENKFKWMSWKGTPCQQVSKYRMGFFLLTGRCMLCQHPLIWPRQLHISKLDLRLQRTHKRSAPGRCGTWKRLERWGLNSGGKVKVDKHSRSGSSENTGMFSDSPTRMTNQMKDLDHKWGNFIDSNWYSKATDGFWLFIYTVYFSSSTYW